MEEWRQAFFSAKSDAIASGLKASKVQEMERQSKQSSRAPAAAAPNYTHPFAAFARVPVASTPGAVHGSYGHPWISVSLHTDVVPRYLLFALMNPFIKRFNEQPFIKCVHRCPSLFRVDYSIIHIYWSRYKFLLTHSLIYTYCTLFANFLQFRYDKNNMLHKWRNHLIEAQSRYLLVNLANTKIAIHTRIWPMIRHFTMSLL